MTTQAQQVIDEDERLVVYQTGFKSRLNELDISTNPFEKDSWMYEEWEYGWMIANGALL